ncbi:MAG: RNA recognition motif domain-containing protein [Polyangiaceae bacterium]
MRSREKTIADRPSGRGSIGWKAQQQGSNREKENPMSNRIYVGNLPFSASADTLREAFASSGEVTDAHVVTDRESGRSRGFGFVTMGSAEQAANAITAMNGTNLDGRSLRVNEAEEKPQRSGGGGFGGGSGGGSGGGGGRRNKW